MDDEPADFVRWSAAGEMRFDENTLGEKNGKTKPTRQGRVWRDGKLDVVNSRSSQLKGNGDGGVSADGNDKEMQLRGQDGEMSRQGGRGKELFF